MNTRREIKKETEEKSGRMRIVNRRKLQTQLTDKSQTGTVNRWIQTEIWTEQVYS